MTTDLEVRQAICKAYGLDESLADRLVGKDGDELHADAEKLAAAIKQWRDNQPLTREAVADMSSEEINRRWPEVEKVLKSGPEKRDASSDVLIWADLRTMTFEEINARWAEVQQVLRSGK